MARYDVLVVDDDRATREGLCEFLSDAGLSVDRAEDGAEALDKSRLHDVGVVLLDINLPGISGLDVLACCASYPKPPKVVIITAVDTPETVLGALRKHAYDFLSKPIEPARLLDVVRRALSTAEHPPIEVLSAKPEWIELLVPCARETVDRIQSFLAQVDSDLPPDLRDSVALAFRELLLNGIEWGGRLNPDQKVRVSCLRTRRMLLYRIADPGPGFQLDELSHAALDAPDALGHDLVRQERGLRPGGFGLALVRAIADELIYNEHCNEVVFVKYLDEAAGSEAGLIEGAAQRAVAS
jgi:CheY-like chemotaxis protein/anti-sigma regulatory factor (Ser/Thr protein kinase)